MPRMVNLRTTVFFIPLMLGIALTSTLNLGPMVVVGDREGGVKRQFFVAGVNRAMYWLGQVSFDAFFQLFWLTACVLIILLFRPEAFLGTGYVPHCACACFFTSGN